MQIISDILKSTYIRISITLQELEASGVRTLVYGDSIAANHRKHLRLPFTQMVVKLATK